MPEIANLSAEFDSSVYSVDLVEHSHVSELTDSAYTAAFNPPIYSADLGSSDLP